FSARYGAAGPWTDVFAMALIFVEVASGRPALQGLDDRQLWRAATDDEDRPSLLGRGVAATAALEAAIQRPAAGHPAQRFPDIGEMWADVLAAQRRSRSTPAPPEGQRRICTVMSIDFSDVSAREPEKVEELLDLYFETAKRHVEAMGGVVHWAA